MGLLDTILGREKAPSTLVTQISYQNQQEPLVDDLNYFQQYELYTYVSTKIRSDAKIQYPPKLQQRKGGEWIDVTSEDKNPLWNDLHRWNPWQTYNQGRGLIEMHKSLAGGGTILLSDEDIDKSHKKFEFYVLNSNQLKFGRTNSAGFPETYTYTDARGQEYEYDREQLILDNDQNPGNYLTGWSPLRAALYTHNSYEEAMRFNFNRFQNDGRADGFYIFPGISDDERKKVEEMLQQKYKGSRNARKTGVLNVEAQFLETTKSQKDLDFVEGLKMLREDILTTFGIPAPMLGFGSSTFNNTNEAVGYFQRMTLKPILDYEADMWTVQMIPRYFGRNVDDLRFIAQNPVEKDRREETEIVASMLREGAITRDEAREMLDLDPVDGEGGDVFLNEQLVRNIPVDGTRAPNEDLVAVKEQLSLIKSHMMNPEKTKAIESRDEMKMRKLKQTLDKEPEFRGSTQQWFITQFTRLANDLKSVSMKDSFVAKRENKLGENHFESTYLSVAGDVSNESHIEVKMALQKVDKIKAMNYQTKGLSGASLALLRTRLNAFVTEINGVSKTQIEQVLSDAIENNLPLNDTRRAIADLGNGYTDGVNNKETLRGLQAYREAIEVMDNNAAVAGSSNRYNGMYELLGNSFRETQGLPPLTKEQRDAGLRALKGVVEGNPDPVASTVNGLLTTIEGIPDSDGKAPGISLPRAETIARTETTAIKGMIQRQTYEENEFVQAFEWLTAGDSFVRDAHAIADGQVVPSGDDFIVGGEFLSYPGDMKGSAANTINCRCDTIPVVLST